MTASQDDCQESPAVEVPQAIENTNTFMCAQWALMYICFEIVLLEKANPIFGSQSFLQEAGGSKVGHLAMPDEIF